MTKRLICLLMAVMFVVCLLPAGTLTASAAATELDVKWNVGAVGGPTNNNKNKVIDGSANYRYSDVIIIEKAGTKVYFTDSSIEGDDSYYLGHTLLVFSTWKKSGDNWVMDLEGANVPGTFDFKNSLGQTLVDGTVAGGMKYEFITDHDNQAIRLSYRANSDNNYPKVYAEPTTEPSTLAQLQARDFTAQFNADGTVTGIQWFCGYASSATNTNGSAKEVRFASKDYATSGLFMVPKAGTKITYTTNTSNPNNAYNAFTRYKLEGNRYVYDVGFDATSTTVKDGMTYSYVTSYDNEVLRIGVRPNLSYNSIAVDEPFKITWQQTNEPGTAANVVNLKTEWPDPELISLVTGAPLIATTELKDLQWHDGYIGSQYHDSKAFMETSPSNQVYDYCDVFTVPKAGTTVYFFDQTFEDHDASKYASTSVMTLSHWTKKGNAWIFDKTREYLTGCDVYNILLTDDYRMYAYTTKEDNENIRLCLRYAPKYSGEDEVIPPVYLVEPTDLAALNTAGTNEASYTDLSGDKVSYSIYLPEGYTADKQYTLVFDNSADSAIAKALIAKNYKGIVVSYTGELAKALRLLDEVAAKYPVKVSDLLLVGNDKLAEHVARFEHIRLAQAMVITSGKAPKTEYVTVKAISDFSSADDAAAWLVGETEDYYSVLEGLTMYAIGDSYFGGSGLGQHQTWVNLLGYKYNMNFHNYGIGGNTVATAAGQSGNQPPMFTRYDEMPKGGDIYIVEGGRNDRHYNVPFGKDTDTRGNSFKGALNVIINGIRKDNPDALIVLVTPWSYLGEKGYLGTNNDYADAMKELVAYHNDPHIVCLYAADAQFTGIDMADVKCRQKYCLTASDVSHLNADGMYKVAPIFDKWLAETYASFKGLTLSNSADDEQFAAVAQPEDTTPAPTTPAETTPAPTTPDETTPADVEQPGESKGCGGVIALGIIACIIPAAVVVLKKKD